MESWRIESMPMSQTDLGRVEENQGENPGAPQPGKGAEARIPQSPPRAPLLGQLHCGPSSTLGMRKSRGVLISAV